MYSICYTRLLCKWTKYYCFKSSKIPLKFWVQSQKNDHCSITLILLRNSKRGRCGRLPWKTRREMIGFYSCNMITTTWIQISRQHWNGFFSNSLWEKLKISISHDMVILASEPDAMLRKCFQWSNKSDTILGSTFKKLIIKVRRL